MLTVQNVDIHAFAFGVLGPTVVRVAGGPPRQFPPKTSQVLAMLLIARGRTVRPERIVRSIWGEEPPNSARIMVRAHVKKVRDGLGPAGARAVVADAGGYAISPGTGTLDADLFEASFGAGRRHFMVGEFEEAKRCFLAGLDLWHDVHALNDVREVAELEAEAVRLEEYRFQAEQSLAECLLLTGDAHEAIPYLRMLTVRHPLRERFWGLLMVAQASLGRRAEASATFRTLRRSFIAESGMDVSTEIEDLHQGLLRGDEPAAMMQRLFQYAPSL
ncbi:AfsR/SARP family transcriptional regulator [Paractinoplanes lichenicola]|uniref:AfsR/SARP family transcriptional regulator n=1 Tax=Paractinoplanes lichenicola TaxID=2802976 RepID=A0ABS1W0B7_9ACTN|nr:AfsR/SARP family transcriptional regulator [Actinoplanes lichenicola]MBL7260155.1 AfsR/SARP family transcriptional regulator [Actinoplanes lichenicola]